MEMTDNVWCFKAVTKEVVKPVVHEQVEEHIMRDTHTHDVYHKILPVRDVEVLPARHWVPGPDGRLIQVDEKDVYSGAAFNLGQTNTTAENELYQDQLHQAKGGYDEVGTGSQQTVKHTSVNRPEVIPGRVNQVYQTQVHQPEANHYHMGLGQGNRGRVDQGRVNPLGQHPVDDVVLTQREVNPEQVQKSHMQQPAVDQYQVPRKPINQEHSNPSHVTFSDIPVTRLPPAQYEGSPSKVHQVQGSQSHHQPGNQHRVNEPQVTQVQNPSSRHPLSQPSSSPDEGYEVTSSRTNKTHHNHAPQYATVQHQSDEDRATRGQLNRTTKDTSNQARADQHKGGAQKHFHHGEVEDDHAKHNRMYQEQGIRHGDKHTGHHAHVKEDRPNSVGQRHVDHDPGAAQQRSDHQTNSGQVSPGLLDPYRVKNGPTHRTDQNTSDLDSKPQPDIPEPSVQKIAGHKILTTEDRSGHTKLHKGPKESKHSAH
jgi:hypothetical protein